MNKLWILGRQRKSWLRLYPNPGFALHLGSLHLYWSKHRGLKFGEQARRY